MKAAEDRIDPRRLGECAGCGDQVVVNLRGPRDTYIGVDYLERCRSQGSNGAIGAICARPPKSQQTANAEDIGQAGSEMI